MPMNAPLVLVTLAFLAGILLGIGGRLPPSGLVVAGAAGAVASLWQWRRGRAGTIALLLLWSCLGAVRMTVWERHPDMRLKEILSDEPQPVQLHAVVVTDPVGVFDPEEPARTVGVLRLLHVSFGDRDVAAEAFAI